MKNWSNTSQKLDKTPKNKNGKKITNPTKNKFVFQNGTKPIFYYNWPWNLSMLRKNLRKLNNRKPLEFVISFKMREKSRIFVMKLSKYSIRIALELSTKLNLKYVLNRFQRNSNFLLLNKRRLIHVLKLSIKIMMEN